MIRIKFIPLLFLLACISKPEMEEPSAQVQFINTLLQDQQKSTQGVSLRKEVAINGKRESKTNRPDSTQWAVELAFLNEINPSTPQYIGAFIIKEDTNYLSLQLKKGEKGDLKSIFFDKKQHLLSASIFEDNEIYTYSKDIQLRFVEKKLSHYRIIGFQKTILVDTLFFQIVGKIDYMSKIKHTTSNDVF